MVDLVHSGGQQTESCDAIEELSMIGVPYGRFNHIR